MQLTLTTFRLKTLQAMKFKIAWRERAGISCEHFEICFRFWGNVTRFPRYGNLEILLRKKKKRRKERSNSPKFFNNAMPSKFVLFIILSKLSYKRNISRSICVQHEPLTYIRFNLNHRSNGRKFVSSLIFIFPIVYLSPIFEGARCVGMKSF